ncbi:MAG: hypothetical protein LBQ66_08665, partial [Planctomycetaceae bacterium]|nr:hypothetical protein [Planctomycetaceae bacterium]
MPNRKRKFIRRQEKNILTTKVTKFFARFIRNFIAFVAYSLVIKKYCCTRMRGKRRGFYPSLGSTLKSNLQYFFNAEGAEGRKRRKFFQVRFPRIPRFPYFR